MVRHKLVKAFARPGATRSLGDGIYKLEKIERQTGVFDTIYKKYNIYQAIILFLITLMPNVSPTESRLKVTTASAAMF